MFIKAALLGALIVFAILFLIAYAIKTTPRLPYVAPTDEVGPHRRDPESSRDTEVS